MLRAPIYIYVHQTPIGIHIFQVVVFAAINIVIAALLFFYTVYFYKVVQDLSKKERIRKRRNLMSTEEKSPVDFVTPMCVWCSETSIVKVPYPAYLKWLDGEMAQYAFKDMSADDRELLISGTHPKCWDLIMGAEV